MKVFFDIITNHTADVITYEQKAGGPAPYTYVSKDASPYRDASGTPFDDRDFAGTDGFPALDAATSFPFMPAQPGRSENPGNVNHKVPEWLNDVTLYHNRGDTTFVGENSQYGDFFGLDDLFTEQPRVVDGMADIYKKWITDFRIDGFRIDTMKHVDDEFWRAFAPEVLAHARSVGKPEFLMFGEVFDTTKRYTSHFTTQDDVQAVLDFPFQAAAQQFAARVRRHRRAARLLRGRRLVHGRGLQRLPAADVPGQPRHGPDRAVHPQRQRRRHRRRGLRARPAGARAHVLLARQPGRLLRRRAGLRRRRRRPGRPPGHVPEPGGVLQQRRQHRHDRDAGGRQLRPGPPALRQARRAGERDPRPPGAAQRGPAAPALEPRGRRVRVLAPGRGPRARVRRGAQQLRAAPDGARADGRRPPRRVHARLRDGPAAGVTDAGARLPVEVPPLSTVVYRSAAPIPRSPAAPESFIAPLPDGGEARDRAEVAAFVDGSSFYDVTFQAKVGGGDWTRSGRTTTAPTACSTTSPSSSRARRCCTGRSCSTTPGTAARATWARPRSRPRRSR